MTGIRHPELDPLLDGCRRALEAEIEAVRTELERRGLGDPVQAGGGRQIDPEGPRLVYEWDLPPAPYGVRPDDAVRIRWEGGEVLGFVSAFLSDGPRVRVSTPEWLGTHPGPALLAFDPTWLLEALGARLEALRESAADYHPATALRVLGRIFPEAGRQAIGPEVSRSLNACQKEALARILGSSVQFVWGPPGTGKTLLLGHTAGALAREGRVLVLAITNAAVDEAAGRIAQRLGPEAVEDGRLVRVGAAFSPTGDPDLSLGAAVERAERRKPGRLSARLAEMEAEARISPGSRGRKPVAYRTRLGRISAAARKRADPDLLARVGRLARELQRAEARALGRADVVLSTFARLTVNDDLAEQRFESLIVDEASTVPLPYLVFGASLARARAVIAGDFQQLPAVVVSRDPAARRWLSQDVFHEARVVAPEDGRPLPDPRDALCAMLVEQYRMRPAIRELVSALFYGNRLVDANEVVRRPARGAALVLIDTTSLSPAAERAEGSRANRVHAEVLMPVLELLARQGEQDVGLVAPYRLQSRRLEALVRARLGATAPRGLEVSTIHRFQGREKSTIVIDTVDAPPGGCWFLDERRNRDFPRLLNVALSRSRERLVVLATVTGLRALLPRDSLLNRIVRHVEERGVVVDARDTEGLRAALGGPAAGTRSVNAPPSMGRSHD